MIPPTNNWGENRTDRCFMRKSQRTSKHGTTNAKTHNRTTDESIQKKTTSLQYT